MGREESITQNTSKQMDQGNYSQYFILLLDMNDETSVTKSNKVSLLTVSQWMDLCFQVPLKRNEAAT